MDTFRNNFQQIIHRYRNHYQNSLLIKMNGSRLVNNTAYQENIIFKPQDRKNYITAIQLYQVYETIPHGAAEPKVLGDLKCCLCLSCPGFRCCQPSLCRVLTQMHLWMFSALRALTLPTAMYALCAASHTIRKISSARTSSRVMTYRREYRVAHVPRRSRGKTWWCCIIRRTIWDRATQCLQWELIIQDYYRAGNSFRQYHSYQRHRDRWEHFLTRCPEQQQMSPHNMKNPSIWISSPPPLSP